MLRLQNQRRSPSILLHLLQPLSQSLRQIGKFLPGHAVFRDGTSRLLEQILVIIEHKFILAIRQPHKSTSIRITQNIGVGINVQINHVPLGIIIQRQCDISCNQLGKLRKLIDKNHIQPISTVQHGFQTAVIILRRAADHFNLNLGIFLGKLLDHTAVITDRAVIPQRDTQRMDGLVVLRSLWRQQISSRHPNRQHTEQKNHHYTSFHGTSPLCSALFRQSPGVIPVSRLKIRLK